MQELDCLDIGYLSKRFLDIQIDLIAQNSTETEDVYKIRPSN